MLFMNQDRLYGRSFREEAGEGEGTGGEGGESEGDGGDSDLAARLEKLEAENNAMRESLERAVTREKQAKAARREADAKAAQEAEERARSAGDFEQLHKSSEEARKALQAQLDDLQSGIARERESGTAMKIAAELADGANADILSRFIGERLRYTDEGIKVTNNNGELTVSTLDDLKNEFANSERYGSLLRGRQSSGGGASGGRSGGGAAKEMTRQEFDNLPPDKRMEFVKGGGKTID